MPIRKNKQADLKASWSNTVQAGFIVSLSVLLTAFLFFPEIGNLPDIRIRPNDVVQLEDIPWTVQKPVEPTPIRPSIPVAAPVDEIIDDSPLLLNSEINLNEVPARAPLILETNEEIPEFVPYEDPPQIIGGMSALLGAIRYPEIARLSGIEGTVVARTLITNRGEVDDVIIIKSLGFGLDEEVIRVLKTMKFKPALQQGKPVKVAIAIPIRFTLKNNK